jgi:hypothetical protein
MQKTKTERDLHWITQGKRNTLPTDFGGERMEVRSGNIPSPSISSQTRINFTYNKLQSKLSSKEIQPLPSQLQAPSRPQTSFQPNKKSKAEKRLSSRLCSEVFNISYAPMEESIRKNRSSTSLFRSRQSHAYLKPYESKITSA